MKFIRLLPLVAVAVFFITNCGEGGSSFSLLAETNAFQQSAGSVNSKIDILWVVDNSGSMSSSQNNLTSNFNSFISTFAAKNLDFKMAFTTTDAYRYAANFQNNPKCAEFRDRELNASCNNAAGSTASGFKIITPTVPGAAQLQNVFTANATTGILGNGDERAFSSFQAALTHTVNDQYAFLRPDSFLAVIIVSDEDDFSWNGTSNKSGSGPNDPALYPISQFVGFLDTITGTTGALRRYNVSSIAIFDSACQAQLNAQSSGRLIGVRYGQLADATSGIKSSLCGNFGAALSTIADQIISLATQFYLTRIPKPETITVKVNGVDVPEANVNPLGDGGWTYKADSNSILFVGFNYIPPKDAIINVHYDPVAYGQ